MVLGRLMAQILRMELKVVIKRIIILLMVLDQRMELQIQQIQPMVLDHQMVQMSQTELIQLMPQTQLSQPMAQIPLQMEQM